LRESLPNISFDYSVFTHSSLLEVPEQFSDSHSSLFAEFVHPGPYSFSEFSSSESLSFTPPYVPFVAEGVCTRENFCQFIFLLFMITVLSTYLFLYLMPE